MEKVYLVSRGSLFSSTTACVQWGCTFLLCYLKPLQNYSI